jgi:hypothetical protein
VNTNPFPYESEPARDRGLSGKGDAECHALFASKLAPAGTYLIFEYRGGFSDLPPPPLARLIDLLFLKDRLWKTFAQPPALPSG